MLVLFAAGNCGDPAYDPDARPSASISSPANFRNGLSVGATMNDAQSWTALNDGASSSDKETVGTLSSFSSRGPAPSVGGEPARIKPEILGTGEWIFSAQADPFAEENTFHSGLIAKRGTSMATPAVAGIAAIVREYFMEGYYSSTGRNSSASAFSPSGALLKAMLIASGAKMSYILSSDSLSAG